MSCGVVATLGADAYAVVVCAMAREPGWQTTHIGVLGVSLVQLYEFMF